MGLWIQKHPSHNTNLSKLQPRSFLLMAHLLYSFREEMNLPTFYHQQGPILTNIITKSILVVSLKQWDDLTKWGGYSHQLGGKVIRVRNLSWSEIVLSLSLKLCLIDRSIGWLIDWLVCRFDWSNGWLVGD